MRILLVLVLSLIAQFFLPWWVVAVVPFGVAFWQAPSAGRAFLAGFAGIALGWLGASLLPHIRTGGLLTERVAHLFLLPHSSLLLLLTALLGGLVGGVAGWAGYFSRQSL